jgi:hypothetical protein
MGTMQPSGRAARRRENGLPALPHHRNSPFHLDKAARLSSAGFRAMNPAYALLPDRKARVRGLRRSKSGALAPAFAF